LSGHFIETMCVSTKLLMFSGSWFRASAMTTMNKTNQMHNSLKIIKTLLYSYSNLHISGTLAPIIRILLILHIQPPVTVCRWVGGVFQLWSVTFATVVTDQSWKTQLTQRHTVTGGCMCRIRRLLMMGARVPETCRAE
jgi:hypothetical protein